MIKLNKNVTYTLVEKSTTLKILLTIVLLYQQDNKSEFNRFSVY